MGKFPEELSERTGLGTEDTDPCSQAGRSLGSPSQPLRLERYVGWSPDTGCEVQRKGIQGEGRKERARLVSSSCSPLTPSGKCGETGQLEASVLPNHAAPSPLHGPASTHGWTALWAQEADLEHALTKQEEDRPGVKT